MQRRAVVAIAVLTLAAFTSLSVGFARIVRAKGSQAAQEQAVVAPTLPTAPSTWVLWASGGGTSGWVSVTKPAGGAGVKHVVTCVIGTFTNQSSLSGDMNLTLRDGPLNTGTPLLFWNGTAANYSSTAVNICDLNVVGSANTPMTLQIADGTTMASSVGLVGYDAQ